MARKCYDVRAREIDCWVLDHGLVAQGVYLDCREATEAECPNGGRFKDIYGNCSNYCSPTTCLGDDCIGGCFGRVREVILEDVKWKKYVIYVLFLLIFFVILALAAKFWNK